MTREANLMKIVQWQYVNSFLITMFLTGCITPVWAAPAVTFPGSSDVPTAGSTMKQVEKQMEIQRSKPAVKLEENKEEQKHYDAKDEVRIKVTRFRVTGQDVLPREDVDAILDSYKKKELNFSELMQISDKLTALFKKKGYMLAKVYLPEQNLDDGTVEYIVVIGRLGNIKVENRSGLSEAAINRQTSALKTGEYVRRQNVERAVWLLNDLSGADARVLFSPGKEEGTTDILIQVDPQKGKHGSVFADNYGNRYTGYYELGMTYDIWNPAHQGDQLSLAVNTTGRKERYGSFNYRIPLWKDGFTMDAGYSYLGYHLGKEYDMLYARGTARVYHVGMDYAFERSSRQNVYGGIRYEYSRLRDEYRAFDLDYADKHSHAAIFSLYGDKSASDGVTSWRFDWKWGNLTFNNNEIPDELDTKGTYSKANVTVMRRQDLTNRLYLNLVGSAQLASRNLDSSEKMSLGGINGVRAYPRSEGSGDNGYLLRAEMRYLMPVKRYDQMLQAAVYVDHGGIKINRTGHSYAGYDNFRRLQGVGVGLIWTRKDDWWVRADYAWRLGAEPATSDTHHSNGQFWLQAGAYF